MSETDMQKVIQMMRGGVVEGVGLLQVGEGGGAEIAEAAELTQESLEALLANAWHVEEAGLERRFEALGPVKCDGEAVRLIPQFFQE